MIGRKAVFIDRDDTIAKNVPYCSDPDDFHLFPGVPEAIKKLNDAGYLVIMVTNQSGINRGYFTLNTLEEIHAKMNAEIEAEGGHIDKIYFCPHRPDENCRCRKPNTLMGERAVEEFGIDVKQSYMIGDSDVDVGFGERLGCNVIRVGENLSFKEATDMICNNCFSE